MTLTLAFVALALACLGIAALLLLSVLLRRGRGGRELALATLLVALAAGLWWSAIREPLELP